MCTTSIVASTMANIAMLAGPWIVAVAVFVAVVGEAERMLARIASLCLRVGGADRFVLP